MRTANGNLARDCAALSRGADTRKGRAPRPHRWRGNFDKPEIGRPTVPLLRLDSHLAVGRDKRKLALERLL